MTRIGLGVRWAPCLLSGAVLLTGLSAPHARVTTPYVVRATATPCLNFRPDPDTDVAPTDCLPPGTPVGVFETRPHWRKVRLTDGREGWVAKAFIEPATAHPVALAVDGGTPAAPTTGNWLEVHFVDVGQGDGIWIHTFDDGIDGNGIFEGRDIIIDGGPNSADSTNELLSYVRSRAHHDAIIDTLIVTHPHIDHYPGAEGILRHFQVRSIYDPGFPKHSRRGSHSWQTPAIQPARIENPDTLTAAWPARTCLMEVVP
jgi:beta-lactamase superfamily II metal-dependent hydrolase